LVLDMPRDVSKAMMAKLIRFLELRGLGTKLVPHEDGFFLLLVSGSPSPKLKERLRSLSFVRRCVDASDPFPLASTSLIKGPRRIRVGDAVVVGGGVPVVMAGPCSVEGEEQIRRMARLVKEAGASVLRGGVFKPRTNPYSFQGLGLEGLRIMSEAAREEGIPIVTEVMEPSQVGVMYPYVDVFQVGTRNMYNYPLLKELGKGDKPVLLKRGMSATVDEWLQAAEYVLSEGNFNVMLCERGIRTFEARTRNTLDLNSVALIKRLSHLPVVVDPSHGTGRRDLVLPMSLAAVAAGADGLLIEVHENPSRAKSDGDQSITPSELTRLVGMVSVLSASLGRGSELALVG